MCVVYRCIILMLDFPKKRKTIFGVTRYKGSATQICFKK